MKHITFNSATKLMRAVTIAAGAWVLLLLSEGLPANESAEPLLKEVMAIEADPDYGEYLASECMTCHNAGQADSNIPAIHGKDAAYLAEALLEYKNSTRENETMRSVAGVLGVEEIAALVTYLSQQ